MMISDPLQKIRFILRQKFDAHISGIDRQGIFVLRARDPLQREQIAKEIEEYKQELGRTPFEELDRLYNDARAAADNKEREAQQREKEQQQQEIEQFFVRPDIRPDYEYWSKLAFWEIDEAIPLSLNLDPPVMEWQNLSPHILAVLGKQARKLNEIVRRAVQAYQLREEVRPIDYLNWVKQHNIDFPKTLADLINEVESKKAKPQKKPIEKPLGNRERDTLLKIIIGIAVDKYRYNPNAEKSGSVTKIKDTLERAGFKISDDTIRAKLQEAEKYLSPEYAEES